MLKICGHLRGLNYSAHPSNPLHSRQLTSSSLKTMTRRNVRRLAAGAKSDRMRRCPKVTGQCLLAGNPTLHRKSRHMCTIRAVWVQNGIQRNRRRAHATQQRMESPDGRLPRETSNSASSQSSSESPSYAPSYADLSVAEFYIFTRCGDGATEGQAGFLCQSSKCSSCEREDGHPQAGFEAPNSTPRFVLLDAMWFVEV
jgi:hypothetical protein